MLTRMIALILEEHNQLTEAITNIVRPRDMDSLLKLLASHTIDEERVMLEVKYNKYLEHRKAHIQLIDTLKDVSLAINTEELRYIVGQHIIEHINTYDIEFLNTLEVINDK